MGAAGSDVAINSASIALMNDDLRRIPFLVKISRKTRRVINQNLAFGVLFIVLGISLSKFVPPALAAVFHFASSIIVVFNLRAWFGLARSWTRCQGPGIRYQGAARGRDWRSGLTPDPRSPAPPLTLWITPSKPSP